MPKPERGLAPNERARYARDQRRRAQLLRHIRAPGFWAETHTGRIVRLDRHRSQAARDARQRAIPFADLDADTVITFRPLTLYGHWNRPPYRRQRPYWQRRGERGRSLPSLRHRSP